MRYVYATVDRTKKAAKAKTKAEDVEQQQHIYENVISSSRDGKTVIRVNHDAGEGRKGRKSPESDREPY